MSEPKSWTSALLPSGYKVVVDLREYGLSITVVQAVAMLQGKGKEAKTGTLVVAELFVYFPVSRPELARSVEHWLSYYGDDLKQLTAEVLKMFDGLEVIQPAPAGDKPQGNLTN